MHHPVTKPRHYYGASGMQAIDIVEAWCLDREHYLATALCYVLRAPRKNGAEDLRKACWYLERLLPRIPDHRVEWRPGNPLITAEFVIEDFAVPEELATVVMGIYCAAIWEFGRNRRELLERAIAALREEAQRREDLEAIERRKRVMIDEDVCA